MVEKGSLGSQHHHRGGKSNDRTARKKRHKAFNIYRLCFTRVDKLQCCNFSKSV